MNDEGGSGQAWMLEATDDELQFGQSNHLAYVNLSESFAVGQWTHILVSTPSKTARTMYINGVNVTKYDGSDWFSAVDYSFGGRVSGSYFFNGTIDEVYQWDRALSSAEALQVFQMSLSKTADNSFTFRSNQTDLFPGVYGFQVTGSNTANQENSTEFRGSRSIGTC